MSISFMKQKAAILPLIGLSLLALLFSIFHLSKDLFTHTANSSGAWQAVGGIATLFATSLLIFQGVQIREDALEGQKQAQIMISAAQAQAYALTQANQQRQLEWGISLKPNILLADRNVFGEMDKDLPHFTLSNMGSAPVFIESIQVNLNNAVGFPVSFSSDRVIYSGILNSGVGYKIELPQLDDLREISGFSHDACPKFGLVVTYFYALLGPKRCIDTFEVEYKGWQQPFNPKIEKVIEMAEG